ncbi:Putative LOC100487802 (Silurana) [Caligus rogercresseyi]|uniref:LOC100487802 (Silurana) n=1 Tax=Caligus rogercresseyi TaxID=217165 RepID=A0A7T8JZF0_CALRO|nr:Putative LOC100487802 (Silurana) [Caligus rogercresseyi]
MGSMSDLCKDIRSSYDLLSCESVTKKDGSVFILIRSSLAEQSNYLPHLNAVIDSGVVKLLSYHGRVLKEENAKESQILKQLNEGKLFFCVGIQEVSSLIGLSNNILKNLLPSFQDLDDSVLKDVYTEPSSNGSILYRSRNCSFYMENSPGVCIGCQALVWAFQEVHANDQGADSIMDEPEDWSMPEPIEEGEEIEDYGLDDNDDDDWKEPLEEFSLNDKCPECSETLHTSNINKHLKTNIDFSAQCSICLQNFTRKCAYNRHIRLHSTLMNLEESIECPICKISLTNRMQLNDHIRDSHDAAQSSCGICWEILSREDLLKHIDKHQKQVSKKHLCPECGKKFNFPFELKYHVARYHDVGGEEFVVCDQCGKGLPHKRALTMHIQRVHKRNQVFPCHLCSKVFHLNHHLKKHVQIHSKVKPFKCALCNYCCARNDNVRIHIRRVHKREPCRDDVLLVSEVSGEETKI